MSGLFGTFKTNVAQEREGRWFDLAGVVNADGTRPGFKMGRMAKTNPTYQAAMERVAKDMRQAIELDILSEDTVGPVVRRVFTEVILLDWRNVFNEEGEVLPFSRENAERLMEELPDLYLILVEEAQRLSNFRGAEVEAVAKKSSLPSKKPLG